MEMEQIANEMYGIKNFIDVKGQLKLKKKNEINKNKLEKNLEIIINSIESNKKKYEFMIAQNEKEIYQLEKQKLELLNELKNNNDFFEENNMEKNMLMKNVEKIEEETSNDVNINKMDNLDSKFSNKVDELNKEIIEKPSLVKNNESIIDFKINNDEQELINQEKIKLNSKEDINILFDLL